VDEWLPGLKRGEARAFDAVYAHYHRRIYDFLFRMSGRRDLAEDLFQETWLQLARHATRLAEDTDLGAWLFTVARNRFRSHRRWVLIDLERRQQLAVEPAAGAPTAEARRQLAEVERALARLRDADREVLLLVAVEGMEQERAAAVLGLSYDALRQRLSRARAQLAAELAPAGERTGT
jgi:RNA polymerase sigma-70 factor (ECF subfamily)